MPDPRSTTPTRNPSAFNSPYNPASVALPSTQRSSDTTATKQSPLPLRSSPSPSARSPKKRGHSSDSELVADADPAKQQHPLKKMRSRDPRSKEAEAQGQVDRSSSSDSSSQERTDTETGIYTRDALDPSSASAHPPSAKKRTRTLTTPHQSAVLHALLAQSPFPTTAMREEVGQSIGLSARKVQIWFQNQRQKARRPQSQTTTSPPPLQRDAGPSAIRGSPHQSGAPTTMNLLYALPSTPNEPGPERHGRVYPPPIDARSGPFAKSPRLQGPGMPGLECTHAPGYSSLCRTLPPPPSGSRLRSSPPRAPQRDSLVASQSEYRLHTPAVTAPSCLPPARVPSVEAMQEGFSAREREHDPSRTLPPLTFPPREQLQEQYTGSAMRETGSITHTSLTRPYSYTIPHYDTTRQPSQHPHHHAQQPGTTFTHPHHPQHPHQHAYHHSQTEHPGQQASAAPFVLPPPITLQPKPMWDSPPPFAGLPRSGSSSASGSASAWGRSSPGDRRAAGGGDVPMGQEAFAREQSGYSRVTSSPRQSRRFDPVRASAAGPFETPGEH